MSEIFLGVWMLINCKFQKKKLFDWCVHFNMNGFRSLIGIEYPEMSFPWLNVWLDEGFRTFIRKCNSSPHKEVPKYFWERRTLSNLQWNCEWMLKDLTRTFKWKLTLLWQIWKILVSGIKNLSCNLISPPWRLRALTENK